MMHPPFPSADPQPLQPDQDIARWDRHAASYEAVFERLTDAFAAQALDLIEPIAGAALLDLAAGAGGAALQAAARGAHVTAFDASAAMVTRISARAAGASIVAEQVDARLPLPRPDAAFDAALSCFGVVILPDPVPALRDLHRVLRPGGRIAVVTWTEPGRYELATRLWTAVERVRGAPPPPGPVPAQLRYTDPDALAALMVAGGFGAPSVTRVEAPLRADSARALAAVLDFAPGMAALLGGLGPDRAAVEEAFAAALEADQGHGPVALGAVAQIAVATRA
ncbi:class I SAM-dependent methyltransferase [Roseomonas sp. CECT 9278]|uniref:class I SAM-dependent methyltransferase n=1 Tax=Roseomonas sp. CECT 9278 TaxID=2845823 RepID=UPI001E3933C9|nr:class I SAM-dependent methyltransferase [Roseomonas sp. CECT 9278]CAH0221286.1 2-methoxy-6-polyprenyl-1,4-benzoquinol methylase, mitochondrial [Roseomonas sp. CECT 9278]